MANIGGGAQITISKGTFYGMYMKHPANKYDKWLE